MNSNFSLEKKYIFCRFVALFISCCPTTCIFVLVNLIALGVYLCFALLYMILYIQLCLTLMKSTFAARQSKPGPSTISEALNVELQNTLSCKNLLDTISG